MRRIFPSPATAPPRAQPRVGKCDILIRRYFSPRALSITKKALSTPIPTLANPETLTLRLLSRLPHRSSPHCAQQDPRQVRLRAHPHGARAPRYRHRGRPRGQEDPHLRRRHRLLHADPRHHHGIRMYVLCMYIILYMHMVYIILYIHMIYYTYIYIYIYIYIHML